MAKNEVRVRFTGDVADLKRATAEAGMSLDVVEKKAGPAGERWKDYGQKAMVAGGAAVFVGAQLYDLGQRLNVYDAKAKTVFEGDAARVERWADQNNESFGVSKQELNGLAASFGDLVKPMGLTASQAADMSTEVVGLAGALSAWSGGQRTAAEVTEILAKAMLGERDGLVELGIKISDADVQARLLAKGQQELTGAALQQATAIATQELIFEKSTDAQRAWTDGTMDGIKAANESKAAMADLQAELAQRLVPAGTAVMEVVGGVADAFNELPGWMKEVIVTGGAVATGFSVVGGAVATAYGHIKDFKESVRTARENGTGLASTMTGALNPAVLGTTAAIGAGIGIYEAWAGNVARVEQESEQLSQTLIEQGADVLPTLAKAYKDVLDTRESFDESFAQSGMSVTQVTRAIEGNAGAFQRWHAASDDLLDGLDERLIPSSDRSRRNLELLRERADALPAPLRAIADRMLEQYEAGELGGNALREFFDGMSDVAEMAVKTADDIEHWATQIEKTVGPTKLSEAAQRDLATAMDDNASLTKRRDALMRLAEANADVAEELGLIPPAAEDAAEGIESTGTAAEQTTEALDEFLRKTQAVVNPLLALEDANYSVAEAQKKVTDAEREHGRNSPEYQRALSDAARAAMGHEAAMQRLSTEIQNGNVSVESAKATLQRWVAQGVLTQAQADQTAWKFGLLAGQAKTLNGTDVTIPVSANTEDARRKLDALLAQLSRLRTPQGIVVLGGSTAAREARASGGPVRRGVPYLVGEEGPEVVTFDQDGTVIPNDQIREAPTGARPMAGALAAAGPSFAPMASTARIDLRVTVDPVVAQPIETARAVVGALEEWARVNGPLPRALVPAGV